jgi:hypothetical protein
VYSFTAEDILYLMKKAPQKAILQNITPPKTFLSMGRTALHQDHQQGAEWTGNEARPGELDAIYFHSSILIQS